MTYTLAIGIIHPLYVGPFDTAIEAQHWAEEQGIDTWRLMEIEHPVDALYILEGMRE